MSKSSQSLYEQFNLDKFATKDEINAAYQKAVNLVRPSAIKT